MADQQNNYEEVEFLTITNEDGAEEKFEIIHEFDHATNGYRYLLLTPFSEEETDGEVEVYPVRCKISDDEEVCEIETLETDEEWEMVEQVLQSLEEQDGNEGNL